MNKYAKIYIQELSAQVNGNSGGVKLAQDVQPSSLVNYNTSGSGGGPGWASATGSHLTPEQSQEALNTLGSGAKWLGKTLYVDPFVNGTKDSISARQMMNQGDWAGGGTRFLSSVGNFGVGLLNIVPTLGLASKGIFGATEIAANALRGIGALNAARRATQVGEAIGVATKAPVALAARTPLVNRLTYQKPMFAVTPATSIGGRAVNAAKSFGNAALPPFAYNTPQVGDALYSHTRGAKMERMVQENRLEPFIGEDAQRRISELPRGQQLEAFDQLNRMGLVDQAMHLR